MGDLTSFIEEKIDEACRLCGRNGFVGVVLIGSNPLLWDFYHYCCFRELNVVIDGLESYDGSQKWYKIKVDELLSRWNVG